MKKLSQTWVIRNSQNWWRMKNEEKSNIVEQLEFFGWHVTSKYYAMSAVFVTDLEIHYYYYYESKKITA